MLQLVRAAREGWIRRSLVSGRVMWDRSSPSVLWYDPIKSVLLRIYWRRGRDPNPRWAINPQAHYPGVLLKPLGHLCGDY